MPHLLCAACREPVSVGATRCPHCRADLDRASVENKQRAGLLLVGVLLSLTVIGAVIGLPLVFMGVTGLGVKTRQLVVDLDAPEPEAAADQDSVPEPEEVPDSVPSPSPSRWQRMG
ncbi:MAG: hypothetical protein R2752_13555 [Vicinamibacterales bacterium]